MSPSVVKIRRRTSKSSFEAKRKVPGCFILNAGKECMLGEVKNRQRLMGVYIRENITSIPSRDDLPKLR